MCLERMGWPCLDACTSIRFSSQLSNCSSFISVGVINYLDQKTKTKAKENKPKKPDTNLIRERGLFQLTIPDYCASCDKVKAETSNSESHHIYSQELREMNAQCPLACAQLEFFALQEPYA